MWLAFLAVHLTGSVGYNLMVRRSMRLRANPWAVAAILQTGIAVPMLVALAVRPPIWSDYSALDLIQVAVTAALVFMIQLANVKSLQYLEAGVYAVLYNVRIVFATILGIAILNEPVVWRQILGGALILLSAVVIRQNGARHLTQRGVVWGLAAAVIIAVLNMNEKDLIDRIGYLDYTIPGMLLASIALWVAVAVQRVPVPTSTFRQPRMLVLMTLRAASAYGFLAAFATGAVLSVGTYISALSVVIMVALGALLLGERDHLGRKAISIALALVGLTLIVWQV